MFKIPNYDILDAKSSEPAGYVTKDGMWAAVPFGNRFMIIHNGKQGQVCNTLESAKKHINSQINVTKKSKSAATLETHIGG
jgi:hypothetical protein